MAVIGNWGLAVIFKVSEKQALTFRNLTRTISSEWAKHSRIGLKDQSEFLRPGLQQVTFDIELDATSGVKPRTTADRIARLCEAGSVYPLVVGGRLVGRHRWKITQISEAWEIVYSRGQVAREKLTVTMEEYL